MNIFEITFYLALQHTNTSIIPLHFPKPMVLTDIQLTLQDFPGIFFEVLPPGAAPAAEDIFCHELFHQL